MRQSGKIMVLGIAWVVATLINCQGASIVSNSGQFFPSKTHRKPTILDLRLERVAISGLHMEQAIFQLAQGIASSTHGKVNFAVSTENSRDPMDRVPKRNPKVRFEGSNVSLRQVVDTLCQQSGWSYTKTDAGYAFTDDDRFFKKRPDR
jgi:hypothetical protein